MGEEEEDWIRPDAEEWMHDGLVGGEGVSLTRLAPSEALLTMRSRSQHGSTLWWR